MIQTEAVAASLTGYLGTLATSALLTLAAAAVFNLAVDPKGLYLLVRLDGFNSYKVFQPLYTREYKALAVRRYHPDTLVFGASPVTFGIVPQCPSSTLPGVSRIYNYGGVGDHAETFLTDIDDLTAIGSIRRIVVEARFVNHQFFMNSQRAQTATWAAVPTTPHSADGLLQKQLRPWMPSRYAATYVENLFSWRELFLSVRTVSQNRLSDKSFLFREFGIDGSYDQQWLQRWRARVISETNMLSHVSNYSGVFLTRVSNDMEIDFSYIGQLAAASRRNGIALDIFILPEHVSELLLYSEGGIWPLYQKFKLNLLDAVETARKRESANIRLFDFGNINEVTTQPIRSSYTDAVYDPYFEDPVHFRRIVGDFLLATMLECGIAARVPTDFGLQLNRDNMLQHLRIENAKLEEFRLAHPDMVRKISEAIGNRRKELLGTDLSR